MAFLQAQGDEEQHQHADKHMEAMETGEHEEGGAEDAGAKLEVQICVGMVVLVALHAQEDSAEQHGGPHEQDSFAAITGNQRVVSNCHGHAGGQ